MTRILSLAGAPKSALNMIGAIIDTCRQCRQWTRPNPDSMASARIVVGFNIEVEGDILFVKVTVMN